VVPPRTAAQRVVLRTRSKLYPYRPRANRLVRLAENGKPKVYFFDDPGGSGEEVAQERLARPSCACAQNGK